jgi:AcrR family transcriptional regulator
MSQPPKQPTVAIRRGRRPGQSTTRQAILDAARQRFALDGYSGATIRAIAADAGVDSRLVTQYFRTKEELLAAVMSISSGALDTIANAFVGPSNLLGERVVRSMLAVWEGDQPDGRALRAALRGAIANEGAAELLRDFIQSRLIDGTRELTDADATFRAGLASSLLIGVVVARSIIEVPTLVEAEMEKIISALSPAIQQLLVPLHPSLLIEGKD